MCIQLSLTLVLHSFANTLASIRQWKHSLPSQSLHNRASQWMHWSIGQVKSLLPIYFDRVRAFASPLYGFDVSKLLLRRVSSFTDDSSTNWNSMVQDFLRNHARNSASYEIALALVFEATSFGSYRIEQGYSISRLEDSPKSTTKSTTDCAGALETRTALEKWPAVYLRSSSRLGHVSICQQSPHASSVWSSQGSLRRGVGPSSPPVAKRKQTLLSPSPLVSTHKGWSIGCSLEYAPDVGDAYSFPHTKWEPLGSLLEAKPPRHLGSRVRPEVSDVRSHYFEHEVKVAEPTKPVNSSIFSFHWNDSRQNQQSNAISHGQRLQSSYHIISVAEHLKLAVIVEGRLDEPKRHERRNSTNSEDVRAFLRALARRLSVRALIWKDSVSSLKVKTSKQRFSKLPSIDLSSPEHQVQAQVYLNDFKENCGIHCSGSFFHEGSLYSPRRLSQPSPRSKFHQNLDSWAGMTQSAAALFLGTELANVVQ